MARFSLDADRHIFALHRELRANQYSPGSYRLRVICDPKTRLIAAAPIRDRVVHQSIIFELAPHYEQSFLPQGFAWGQGRGPQRALLSFLRQTRLYRYRLSLDIKRYFPSIVHHILLGLLARRLHDPQMLALLEKVVRSGGAVYQTAVAAQVLGLQIEPLPPRLRFAHWVLCQPVVGSAVPEWA